MEGRKEMGNKQDGEEGGEMEVCERENLNKNGGGNKISRLGRWMQTACERKDTGREEGRCGIRKSSGRNRKDVGWGGREGGKEQWKQRKEEW